jgi:hypothetical protein
MIDAETKSVLVYRPIACVAVPKESFSLDFRAVERRPDLWSYFQQID